MKVEVQFTNQAAILKQLGVLAPEIEKAYASELYASAEEVMTAAKERTPVDTGALRASGHVQPPVIESGKISVELGFGGPAVDYAVVQHEDLSLNHQTGQAKFLEEPLMERQNEIQAALNAAVTEALRQAGFRQSWHFAMN